ncbi:hypothetical protein J1N35_032583 [Gossypium stocksii]|uniref:Aminotransferase-like plant mobile domain-containing protein n=1 Tax=Gossypium stocksii TaxID=47602 RepID=A0A9D3ZUV4_9ROSI|nr:hypothetical protein J1N35_032583 [Gossypium stocksii]
MEAQTHTFHFPCDECTITFENVALQLGLSVDGSIVTGSVIVPGKVDLYKAMLGKVPNRFDGSRILINWLEDNFKQLPKDPTEEVIEQYVQAPPIPCRNPPCNCRPPSCSAHSP